MKTNQELLVNWSIWFCFRFQGPLGFVSSFQFEIIVDDLWREISLVIDDWRSSFSVHHRYNEHCIQKKRATIVLRWIILDYHEHQTHIHFNVVISSSSALASSDQGSNWIESNSLTLNHLEWEWKQQFDRIFCFSFAHSISE